MVIATRPRVPELAKLGAFMRRDLMISLSYRLASSATSWCCSPRSWCFAFVSKLELGPSLSVMVVFIPLVWGLGITAVAVVFTFKRGDSAVGLATNALTLGTAAAASSRRARAPGRSAGGGGS